MVTLFHIEEAIDELHAAISPPTGSSDAGPVALPYELLTFMARRGGSYGYGIVKLKIPVSA